MPDRDRCLIFDVKKYAIHDGPGIRTTVFMKGCPLRCRWCHNPEGLEPWKQVSYQGNRCIGCRECVDGCPETALCLTERGIVRDEDSCRECGHCAEVCPSGAWEAVGRDVSVSALVEMIEKDLIFYESSGGGVTFSGGEPLLQHEALLNLLERCSARGIHTVVDTTGFAPWKCLSAVSGSTDLFLYDLKLMDCDAHKIQTGVSNTVILDNLERLSGRGSDILIRIPLLHGINDLSESLEQMGRFIAGLPQKHPVEILPYHDIHRSKYRKLNREYMADDLSPVTREQARQAAGVLEKFGLDVSLG